MGRIRPTDTQAKRLFELNADRCCVCKTEGLGLHLHHIDGDNSNTTDDNIAVLCVRHHDKFHRPRSYSISSPDDKDNIYNLKVKWEAFVAGANDPSRPAVATITCYGTRENIHAVQVVYQWRSQEIVHVESYHVIDKTIELICDDAIRSCASIGKYLPVILVQGIFPVEHCPCCHHGFNRTTKTAAIAAALDRTWATSSRLAVHVATDRPVVSIALGSRAGTVLNGTIHRCHDNKILIDVPGFPESVNLDQSRSARSFVRSIIGEMRSQWRPARMVYSTTLVSKPTFVKMLDLPACWEIDP